MRNWIDLFEGYYHSIQHHDTTVEVFKNPSWREMSKMLRRAEFGTLRGLIDVSGDLYVWPEEEVEHNFVSVKLNINWDARIFLSIDGVQYYADDLEDGPEELAVNENLKKLYGDEFQLEIY